MMKRTFKENELRKNPSLTHVNIRLFVWCIVVSFIFACVLRVACCVLRVACCVLRVACCVLRVLLRQFHNQFDPN